MNNIQAHDLLAKSMRALLDIPDELVDSLYGICKMMHIKKGQLFLRAGDVSEYVGFNLNGIFRLYYVDDDGNDLTKGFSTVGKFVISYSALVQHRPSYFSIEAVVDTDILRFKYSHWMQLIEQDIKWYPFLFKLLETVYIMKELREKSFLLDDATTRYLSFQRDYPGLEDKVKLYHVASFIGITPEALSRIRKKLKLI
jgi:CRP-like cAMP-binding protein